MAATLPCKGSATASNHIIANLNTRHMAGSVSDENQASAGECEAQGGDTAPALLEILVLLYRLYCPEE